jgi:excisionase family DNA binding protein
MFDDCNEVLEPKDIMKILRISPSNAYKLLKKGDIPSTKIGSQYKVLKADLIQFMEQHKTI